MSHLLYLMFRCDRRCDGKFGKFENFVGTKHTHRQDDYTSTRLPLLQLGPRRKARGPTWKRDPPRSRPRDPSPLFNLTPATEGGGDARPAPAPGQAGGRGGGVSESRQAPGPPGPGPAEPPLPHVSRRQRYTLLPPSLSLLRLAPVASSDFVGLV